MKYVHKDNTRGQFKVVVPVRNKRTGRTSRWLYVGRFDLLEAATTAAKAATTIFTNRKATLI